MLARMRARVEGVGEPQGVVEALLPLLRACFPVDRASIRRIEDSMLEIVAVWSAVPTSLDVGTTMSVMASSLPALVRTGRPVLQPVVAARELLDEVMAIEGVASYVTLPLRDQSRIVGLLSFSSLTPGAFSSTDLDFLENVAAIVEVQVVQALTG
jgi:GAF domain-containing protein